MLKTVLFKIFILLITSTAGLAQTAAINDTLINTQANKDSVLQNAEIDSRFADLLDTVKNNISTTTTIDSIKYDKTIPQKIEQTLFEDLQLNPISIIKSINFWTFLQLFIWISVGTLLIRLINKSAKSKFVNRKFLFYSSILSILKISVWFVIFYIIFFWVLSVPQNILWIMLLGIFIMLGVSAVPFFKNIVGGFYISLSSPFEKGNNIVINGLEGQVININWRSVKILTEENNEISIPNSIFLTNPVTNISFGERERLIVLEYIFPFKFDPAEVLTLLKEAALSSPYIFNEIEPKVYLIKTDLVNQINTYELNVYIIDIKFENEFKSLFNNMILSSIDKRQ